MATPWQGEGDEKAGNHIRRGCLICYDNREGCWDLLHFGLKAPLLCFCAEDQRRGPGGVPRPAACQSHLRWRKNKRGRKMGAPAKRKDLNKGSMCNALSTSVALPASRGDGSGLRDDQAVPRRRSPAHQNRTPRFHLDWRVLILNVF